MSVRRLAEPQHQPQGFAFSPDNLDWARHTIGKYPAGRQQSAVIPLLMRAQEQEGWVTKAAIEHVADMLDMPYIRVLEVATFYTQFQIKPVGTRAHVQVCGTTPCMLRGSEALIDLCRRRIHSEQLHPNAEGTLSWEEVECQGACVNAPMVMIFKDTYEDLTPERLEEIIDAFEAGRGDTVQPGPQIDRIYSAPVTGLTSLTDETAVTKTNGSATRRRAAAGGSAVAPSRAGRPKTDAPETSPGLKSPSPVKVSTEAEKQASVKAPGHNAQAADSTAPETETKVRPRAHARHNVGDADHASPELSPGKPIGAGGKRRAGEKAAPEGDMSAGVDAGGTGVEPARASGASTGEAGKKPPLDSADRPAAMEKPAQPDDLQLISGVGPKIEATLHSLGIFTYSQIAAWEKKERDWVDRYLNFRGRIEREDWVRQADALARGGEAEYVRVFGRKPR